MKYGINYQAWTFTSGLRNALTGFRVGFINSLNSLDNMEFNQSYGMRYAPEDEPLEVDEKIYCAECCKLHFESEMQEAGNGDLLCPDCFKIYLES